MRRYNVRVSVYPNKFLQRKEQTHNVSKLLHKRTSILRPDSIGRRFTTSTRIKDRPRFSWSSSILDAPLNAWKFDKYTVFAIDILTINDQAVCTCTVITRSRFHAQNLLSSIISRTISQVDQQYSPNSHYNIRNLFLSTMYTLWTKCFAVS